MQSGLLSDINSLDPSLHGVGRTVISYEGFDWFTTTLTGILVHRLSGSCNAFAFVPYGDPQAVDWMSSIGVRQTTDIQSDESICVYNDPTYNMHLKEILSNGSRILPNQSSFNGRQVLVEAPELRFSDEIMNNAYAHNGTARLTLKEFVESGAGSLVTTDWRAALVSSAMSVPCHYASGSPIPPWAEEMITRGHEMEIIKIHDNDQFQCYSNPRVLPTLPEKIYNIFQFHNDSRR